jgi:hypothetical protein
MVEEDEEGGDDWGAFEYSIDCFSAGKVKREIAWQMFSQIEMASGSKCSIVQLFVQ